MNPTSSDGLSGQMDSVDEDWDHLPNCQELYRRWERQHWAVHQLDLSQDRQQWAEMSPGERWQWSRLAGFAHFRVGEATAVEVLPAYIDSLDDPDARIYLASQIADEARHMALFARYSREVLAAADPDDPPPASAVFRYLFVDALRDAAAKVRAERTREALAEGLLLTHVLLEGCAAMATFPIIRQVAQRAGRFPGLVEGLTHLHRDECRHALFGLRVLHDAIRAEPALVPPLNRRLGQLVPSLLRLLDVQPERAAALRSMGMDPYERRTRALSLLRRHTRTLGLDLPVAA